MILSGAFWGFALLIAGLSAGVAFLLNVVGSADSRSSRDNGAGVAIGGTIIAFVVSLLCVRFSLYYVQPAFQGAWFGYFGVLIAGVVPALIAGAVFSRSGRSVVVAVLIAAVFFGVPLVQTMYNCFGPNNGIRNASVPNIKLAPADAKMPPTDPDHLVQVTNSIAAFKGQTVLGALGSKFHIPEGDYTLQAVRGHRYYIAPTSPSNIKDTLNLSGLAAPGYVVVDAENPEADAYLQTKDASGKDLHIRLFTDQWWGQYLNRFVYQNGYTDGILSDPKFEVDDNWRPHWVLGYYKRPFGGGVAGRVLDKVILVDVSEAEPKITAFDPKDREKYAWVDRAISRDLVEEYANDWGFYGGDFAKANPWTVFWGWDKSGTMKTADIELNYTTGEENVWVCPMASTNEADHSVVGVLVYETNRNEATYYPGLNNFNIGDSVIDTMFHARGNIKGYHVEHVQLTSIYGELTWVAIYAAPQKIGKSFGGIGLLHAHKQNTADVIFANDKATALSQYATQLAQGTGTGEHISKTAIPSTEVRARIWRIAPVLGQAAGTTFQFKVLGQSRTFVLSTSVYTDAPLVREGDEVVFTYLDTKSQDVPVNNFSCPTLEKLQDAEAAPSAK